MRSRAKAINEGLTCEGRAAGGTLSQRELHHVR